MGTPPIIVTFGMGGIIEGAPGGKGGGGGIIPTGATSGGIGAPPPPPNAPHQHLALYYCIQGGLGERNQGAHGTCFKIGC